MWIKFWKSLVTRYVLSRHKNLSCLDHLFLVMGYCHYTGCTEKKVSIKDLNFDVLITLIHGLYKILLIQWICKFCLIYDLLLYSQIKTHYLIG